MADNEGTMVIRAWVERAQGGELRARLISSQPDRSDETVEMAGDAEQVLRTVDRWLKALQSADGPPA